MKTFWTIGMFTFLFLSNAAMAQDQPTSGLIYNTTEWGSLQYDCTLQPDGTLNCDMTQASVRRESSGKKLNDEIAKTLTQFKAEKPMKPEQCVEYEQTANKIKNPDPAAQGYAEIRAMDPRAKEDLLKMISGLVEFCRNPTEQNLTKMTTIGFERETRTCKVGTNNFSLKFKRVEGSQTWVSNNGPTGACGVVLVARMEQDSKYPTFYNYIQKKVITNPSANVFGSMKCSDLDQSEYKFQWQSREIYGKCDYIKFGL